MFGDGMVNLDTLFLTLLQLFYHGHWVSQSVGDLLRATHSSKGHEQ